MSGEDLARAQRMAHDQERPLHPKDRVPPEEGVVVPAEEVDRVNDRSPTEHVDPTTHEGHIPDKRPTDGPL